MTVIEQTAPLATLYKPGWEMYQHALIQTIAPHSSEQLAVSLGSQQRPIGALLDHMIGADSGAYTSCRCHIACFVPE